MRSISRLVFIVVFSTGLLFAQGCSLFSGDEVPDPSNGGPGPGDEEVVNLIRNPGFEELDGDRPTGWGATGGGWGGGMATVSAEAARTGEYGIKLTSDSSDGVYAVQTVPVVGGKRYEFSAWMKSSPGTPGRMKVEIPGNAAASINPSFDPAEEWTLIKAQIDVPVGTEEVLLLLRLISGPGEVYYDDASFHVVE